MVQVQELVQAGVYPDVNTAIQEAMRILWQERPFVRINVAAHRYQTEELSVARAAAIAGISFDRMKEILVERAISLRMGPETVEEAYLEVDALHEMRKSS